MIMRLLSWGAILALIVFAPIATTQAQTEICPALVNEVLAEIGTTCANLDRNSACYGNDLVEANFRSSEVPFTTPGDRIPLTNVEAIRTMAFDETAATWGVSLLHLSANLPITQEGRGLILLATGGVEIENGVDPTEVQQVMDQPLVLNTEREAEMLTEPDVNGDAITPVPANSEVFADGISPDGEWVRVQYRNDIGWVNVNVFPDDTEFGELVEILPDALTPFQELYFRVGMGGQSCAEAPSMVFAQSSLDTPARIRVHGVELEIQGSAVFRTVPPGDMLGNAFEVITLSGLVTLNPGQANEVIVPPGFLSSIALGEFISLGIEGDVDEKMLVGSPTTPRSLTAEEFAALDLVTNVPDNLLSNPVTLPQIIVASGIGGPQPRLVFTDPRALELARQLCAAGQLPVDVCRLLGLSQ